VSGIGRRFEQKISMAFLIFEHFHLVLPAAVALVGLWRYRREVILVAILLTSLAIGVAVDYLIFGKVPNINPMDINVTGSTILSLVKSALILFVSFLCFHGMIHATGRET
jgi:hypothetical protein